MSAINVQQWYISNNLTLTMYFERVPDWKKLAVLLLDRDDDCQMYKTCVIEKSNHYDV